MTAVPLHRVARRARAALGFAIALAGLSGLGAWAQPAPPLAPTSTTLNCPDPNPPFVMPPEFVSSGRILKGTLNLTEQFIRLPTSVNGGTPTCAPQLVRVFQGDGLPPPPPGAAAGGRLCRSAAGPDLAGARRRSGSAHLHQSGQFESLRSQHRSRGVHSRRRRTARPTRGRSTSTRTACTHRARRISTSTGRTRARARPATMSISRSVRCRATTRET